MHFRRQVLLFFALAITITWGIGAAALGLRELGLISSTYELFDPTLNLLLFLAVWGPGFSALLLSYFERGWSGITGLLSAFLVAGRGVWWWLAAAAALPLALQVAALLIANRLAGTSFERFGPESWGSAAHFFIFGFFASPLGEEIGWRGYALPRLTRQMSALAAALLLGVIWIVWHAPVFVVPGLARSILPSGLSYTEFAVAALAVSVLSTWTYINGRSLLLPVVFHFLVLFQATSIDDTAPPMLIWTSIGMYVAAAFLVVAITGPALRGPHLPVARSL